MLKYEILNIKMKKKINFVSSPSMAHLKLSHFCEMLSHYLRQYYLFFAFLYIFFFPKTVNSCLLENETNTILIPFNTLSVVIWNSAERWKVFSKKRSLELNSWPDLMKSYYNVSNRRQVVRSTGLCSTVQIKQLLLDDYRKLGCLTRIFLN
jgi:hypothetical protein